MTRPLVFLHVPRTGGTTLREHLVRAFPPAEVCPHRFAELYRHTDEELARWRLFAGHFRMDEVRRIPGDPCVVTVLRDPRARILSLRRFWRRHGLGPRPAPDEVRIARETTLLEFLRCTAPTVRNALDNTIARDLAGLVQTGPEGWRFAGREGEGPATRMEVLARALDALMGFSVVGFTEALDAVPAAVAAAFGAPLDAATAPLPRRNAAGEPRPDLHPPEPEEPVDAAAEAELARLTELDRVVVALARDLVRPGEAVARPAARRVGRLG